MPEERIKRAGSFSAGWGEFLSLPCDGNGHRAPAWSEIDDGSRELLDHGDAGVVRRAWSRSGPEESTLPLVDGDVVDAGLAPSHQAAPVEFPQLIAIAAEPVARGVVPFILE
jgi:hypothetical protein